MEDLYIPELGRSASIGQFLMSQPPLMKGNSVMNEQYHQQENDSPGENRFNMQVDIEDNKSEKE